MKKIEFTTGQIAQILGGKVEGDEQLILNNFGKIETAGEGDLTFLSNPKYEQFIYTTNATAVLVKTDFQAKEAVKTTLIRVDDPYSSIAQLLQMIAKEVQPTRTGIHPRAIIDKTATIGDNCYIGANVVIEESVVIGDNVQIYPNTYIGRGAKIGSGSLIYANVSVYYACLIGERCVLHSGAVIGADGFGFAPSFSGYEKIPQIGIVILENDVEVGANTCIDRAAMGSTIVHQGTKLDNLVQIAHNCEVGPHNVFAGQSAMAGSSKTGAWCQLGGQSGVAGHIKVGDRVQLSAKSGITRDTKNDEVLLGFPAQNFRKEMQVLAQIRRLSSLNNDVKELTKKIETLEKN